MIVYNIISFFRTLKVRLKKSVAVLFVVLVRTGHGREVLSIFKIFHLINKLMNGFLQIFFPVLH